MDSNHGQRAYETPALPPELHRRNPPISPLLKGGWGSFTILKDYNNIVNKKLYSGSRFILDKNDTVSV